MWISRKSSLSEDVAMFARHPRPRSPRSASCRQSDAPAMKLDLVTCLHKCLALRRRVLRVEQELHNADVRLDRFHDEVLIATREPASVTQPRESFAQPLELVDRRQKGTVRDKGNGGIAWHREIVVEHGDCFDSPRAGRKPLLLRDHIYYPASGFYLSDRLVVLFRSCFLAFGDLPDLAGLNEPAQLAQHDETIARIDQQDVDLASSRFVWKVRRDAHLPVAHGDRRSDVVEHRV